MCDFKSLTEQDEATLKQRVVKEVAFDQDEANKSARDRKIVGKSSEQEEDGSVRSLVMAQEAVQLAFQNLWEDGKADKLHSIALSHDLKKETLRDKSEMISGEEKQALSSWEKDLKDMTLFNSGRTEKTRRNHLSNAAKGYEEASRELARLQTEKNAISLALKNPLNANQKKEMSEKLMKLIPESEKMLEKIFGAQIETAKARGKRDKAEKQVIEELEQQKRKAMLNLYRQEMQNPALLPAHKESLMQRALKFGLEKDATTARLSLAGKDLAESYKEYEELTEEEVLKEANKNPYNTERKLVSTVWSNFDGVPFDGTRGFGEGIKYGYLCTGNSHFINHYIRILDIEQQFKQLVTDAQEECKSKLDELAYERTAALAKAKNDRERDTIEQKVAKYKAEILDKYKKAIEMADRVSDEADKEWKAFLEKFSHRFKLSGDKLKPGFEKWKEEVLKVMDYLDLATGRYVRTDKKTGKVEEQFNRLPHKTKFYRMLDADILDWGFGLSEQERKMSQADIVELLNRKTGIGFRDKGYMSVGWNVDQVFENRPYMLTMLTEKGKKCFITKNYKEGEVVFGRNTKYMFVCAINHENDAQTLKKTVDVPDSAQSVQDMLGPRVIMEFMDQSTYVDFKGIELVVRVMPDEDEVELPEDEKESLFEYVDGGIRMEYPEKKPAATGSKTTDEKDEEADE